MSKYGYRTGMFLMKVSVLMAPLTMFLHRSNLLCKIFLQVSSVEKQQQGRFYAYCLFPQSVILEDRLFLELLNNNFSHKYNQNKHKFNSNQDNQTSIFPATKTASPPTTMSISFLQRHKTQVPIFNYRFPTVQDEQLYTKQKTLYLLNNQIKQKLSQNNENYFDGVKFLFLGQDNIYKGLIQNLQNKQENNFEYINKKQETENKMIPKQDKILLVAKDQNGDNKIVMEWKFQKDVNLKAILRQISKHKHKKYIRSMNF